MPAITGSWSRLPESDFTMPQPVGRIKTIGAPVGLPISIVTTRTHDRKTGQVVLVESPVVSGEYPITVVDPYTFTLDGTTSNGQSASEGRIFCGPLHFRDQFRDIAETDLITYREPTTGDDAGVSVREIIEAQALVHGWPLIGIYISGAGQTAAHCALHRSQFPTNPAKKPDRLQADLDNCLERIYKWETMEDGNIYDTRQFWATTHVFNYRQDGLYVSGDFKFRVGNSQPRPEWWNPE